MASDVPYPSCRDRSAFAFVVLVISLLPCTVLSRDVFVLISGGDSPLENNYSQFLQARAVVTSWRERYSPDSIWVFFGAGNVTDATPVFGDVRQRVRREGEWIDQWLPGCLPGNHPARRDLIMQALRKEILPSVTNGGTLFLFVGDHGMRPNGRQADSIINLWSLEPDRTDATGWHATDDATLSVSDLREVFRTGLGRGRVVFCMTQCHSGGFHYLAIPRTVFPNPKWFKRPPDWLMNATSELFPLVAGYTATDEYSAAAGCDPAPTVEEWAGYERFLPEKLLGLDLFTLAQAGPLLTSFEDAHRAATIIDGTIDNPYSTSEQYLERWAELIEKRLITDPNLSRPVKRRVESFKRTVDGARPKLRNAAFRDRQKLFDTFIASLISQKPELRYLLNSGTRRQLEQAMAAEEEEGFADPSPRRRGRGGRGQSRSLWNETMRPAWQAAVQSHQVDQLLGLAVEFEEHLLREESNGRDFFFDRRGDMEEEIFWQSGYSDPKSLDRAKAEAIVRWGTNRRSRILEWAQKSEDEAVRAAADQIGSRRGRGGGTDKRNQSIDRRTAAKRVLFYRRVLAAWEFLIGLEEVPALQRLAELTALERTPMPSAR